MTEAEWLDCASPARMLTWLGDRMSERKRRLFSCACCRKALHLMKDERSSQALLFAEGLADGGAKARRGRPAVAEAAKAAAEQARKVADSTQEPAGHLARLAECSAAWAAFFVVQPEARGSEDGAVGHASLALAYATCKRPRVLTSFPPDREKRMQEEGRKQAEILRDVFGDPFRPQLLLHPARLGWNDGAIPKMAQVIYDDRELSSGTLDVKRMAILADGLEDAGCADPQVLEHLRGSGPHVRGCFVVDLLLGKS